MLLAVSVAASAAEGPAATPAEMKGRLERAGVRCKSLQFVSTNEVILDLERCGISDLTPLSGLPVTCLNVSGNGITGLAAVAGMPLHMLSLGDTHVSDLSPPKGESLQYLDITGCPVKTLSTIAGMPLETLYMNGTGVTDLSPLKGMPLKILVFNPKTATDGVRALRGLTNLVQIGVDARHNPMPARVFWAKYDKGDFTKSPAPDTQKTAPLSPAPTKSRKK